MAVDVRFQVGPRQSLANGSENIGRAGATGEVVTGDAHGRYHEAASRAALYAVSTALTGTTIVAGNVSPIAAAAASILSLYNPANSGVRASILKVIAQSISGTPGAGGLAYNVIPAVGLAITATENAVPVASSPSMGRGRCKGFTQTALTGGSVHVLYRPIGPVNFAGALAAGAGQLGWLDEVAGEICLEPGTALSIAAAAAGTTHIVAASIVYEEVPI